LIRPGRDARCRVSAGSRLRTHESFPPSSSRSRVRFRSPVRAPGAPPPASRSLRRPGRKSHDRRGAGSGRDVRTPLARRPGQCFRLGKTADVDPSRGPAPAPTRAAPSASRVVAL